MPARWTRTVPSLAKSECRRFYQHLVEHAVPLNEVAIRELKERRPRSISTPILPTDSPVLPPNAARHSRGTSWPSIWATPRTANDFARPSVKQCNLLHQSIRTPMSMFRGGRSSFILHQRRSRRSSLEPIYGSLESNRAASGKPCPKGQAKQRAGRRRCRKSKPWRFRQGRFSMESAKKLFCGLAAKRVLPGMSI